MLTNNQFTFVVATPTKCGSESLEKDVIEKYEVGRRINGLGKHALGSKEQSNRRYLLVRNPLERFASIYYFLGKSKGNVNDVGGLFDAARASNINMFCKRYVEYQKKTVWTYQLNDYVEAFQPTKVFKLENGLEKLLKEFGVDQPASTINRTGANTGFHALAERMTARSEHEIRNLHRKSMQVLGYL